MLSEFSDGIHSDGLRRDVRSARGLLAFAFGTYALFVFSGLTSSRGRGLDAPPVLFEAKLSQRVERYNVANRSLTDAVLDLAFEYQLPLGIEYLDRGAALRPLTMELRQKTIREILCALVATAPEYRVDFSGGIVHLFSPVARRDSANLLNTVIPNFEVSKIDPYVANIELVCALNRQLRPPAGCGGSFGIGSPQRISIHLRGARVYEILDEIAAKQGAIWTVTVRPENLSKIPPVDFWHVYALDSGFRTVIQGELRKLFPPAR